MKFNDLLNSINSIDDNLNNLINADLNNNLSALQNIASYLKSDVVFQRENLIPYIRTKEEVQLASFIDIKDLPKLVPNISDVKLESNANIYVSFHYGIYTACYLSLVYKKIKTSMIAQKGAIKNLDVYKISDFDKAKEYNPNIEEDFKIYDAVDPMILINCKNDLNAGRSIFLFADQLITQSGKAKKIGLQFLDNYIEVDLGIFMLSYRTKKSIIPLIAAKNSDNKNLQVDLVKHNEINPANFSSLEDFLEFAPQHLYSILENYIKASPYDWLTWYNFHNMLPVSDSISLANEEVHIKKGFNSLKYHLFKIENKIYIIFDIKLKQIYKISENIFILLESIKNNHFTINDEKIKKYPLLKDLIDKGIIIH